MLCIDIFILKKRVYKSSAIVAVEVILHLMEEVALLVVVPVVEQDNNSL